MGLEGAIAPVFDPQIWARVPFHFWSVVFFALGAIVGSFLNVCIYRMPIGKSIISPPSHCPHCGYSIPFYLNIPLVTWVMLGGKCANCRKPISVRYFLVEFLTGLLFFFCWLRFGRDHAGAALAACIIVSGLVVATFIDLEHFIIPDEITIGGAIAGFVCSSFVPALHDAPTAWLGVRSSLIGIAVGGLLVEAVRQAGKLAFGRWKIDLSEEGCVVFTETELILPGRVIPYEEMFSRKTDTVRFHARRVQLSDRCYLADADVALSPIKLQIGDDVFDPEHMPYMEVLTQKMVLPREAMGFGDVKFMAAIGAFLGWQSTVFSLMASSMIGALVSGTLILLGKRERSAQIPFGPYIAAAALVWIFAGPQIMRWFLGQ